MQNDETKPFYPEQGGQVTADAVFSLLPAGLDVRQARILFVHAHPDDESSSTGATMSFYAEAGAQVSLLTATRGEMGEVIPEELKHLEASHPACRDGGAGLGRVREAELAQALKVLRVKEHAFLGQGFAPVAGGVSAYPDSGMSWGPDGRATVNPAAAPDSLTRSELLPQAQALSVALARLKPHVLVTYDAGGGYGHPDHVRTHQMTAEALRMVIGTEAEPLMVWGLEGDFLPDDSRLQAVIDGNLKAKREAMAAHVTQLTVTSDTTFEYSNGVEQKISARETYRLLYSGPGVEADRGQFVGTAASTRPELAGGKAPELEPVLPSPTNSALTALGMGLLAGCAGTFYHAHLWYSQSGSYLPWGSLLAVLTLLLACIWVNERARSSWPGVLAALTAFVLTYAFSNFKEEGYLILLNPQYPVGMAGTVWVLGTLGAAVLATIIYGLSRRRRKAAGIR